MIVVAYIRRSGRTLVINMKHVPLVFSLEFELSLSLSIFFQSWCFSSKTSIRHGLCAQMRMLLIFEFS